MEELISPISDDVLTSELTKLGESNLLISRGDFDVFFAQAAQIPNILLEIGRLRELTFRGVGEGTGKAMDIDRFDEYYYNLFIWDRVCKRIIGGYRIGMGEEIIKNRGLKHFYLYTLFDIEDEFKSIMEKALELGRSYIIPDYQNAYIPFFLLWRGILSVLIRYDQYQYLIGPVSISKYYSDTSKSMIVAFLKRYFYDDELARYFVPRMPFEESEAAIDNEHLLNQIEGRRLRDLEHFLSTIEPKHIKVPVLLKQYTKVNAKFIGFNIDPNFSDVLDGLMLLDLNNFPEESMALLKEK